MKFILVLLFGMCVGYVGVGVLLKSNVEDSSLFLMRVCPHKGVVSLTNKRGLFTDSLEVSCKFVVKSGEREWNSK